MCYANAQDPKAWAERLLLWKSKTTRAIEEAIGEIPSENFVTPRQDLLDKDEMPLHITAVQ